MHKSSFMQMVLGYPGVRGIYPSFFQGTIVLGTVVQYHMQKLHATQKTHRTKKNFIRPTMALHHPGGRRLRRRR